MRRVSSLSGPQTEAQHGECRGAMGGPPHPGLRNAVESSLGSLGDLGQGQWAPEEDGQFQRENVRLEQRPLLRLLRRDGF